MNYGEIVAIAFVLGPGVAKTVAVVVAAAEVGDGAVVVGVVQGRSRTISDVPEWQHVQVRRGRERAVAAGVTMRDVSRRRCWLCYDLLAVMRTLGTTTTTMLGFVNGERGERGPRLGRRHS
jgi:hypothetical protein